MYFRKKYFQKILFTLYFCDPDDGIVSVCKRFSLNKKCVSVLLIHGVGVCFHPVDALHGLNGEGESVGILVALCLVEGDVFVCKDRQ